MIDVRRITEYDSPVFEVVVGKGKGETRHHATMSRESCERLTVNAASQFAEAAAGTRESNSMRLSGALRRYALDLFPVKAGDCGSYQRSYSARVVGGNGASGPTAGAQVRAGD
jgi:hypothetical protein